MLSYIWRYCRAWETTTVKTDTLLKGLRLILNKELAPLRERIQALEVENATLRGEIKAIRKGSEPNLSDVEKVVRRYSEIAH